METTTIKITSEPASQVLEARRHSVFGEDHPLREMSFGGMVGDFFCPAAYYYYIVDFPSKKYEMVSQHVESIFGINPLNFSSDVLMAHYCSEDIDFVNQCERMMIDFLINRIPPDQILQYKISYCIRIKTRLFGEKLFLHQAMVLNTGKNGELGKVLYIDSDIGHLVTDNNYKISFIGLHGNPSYFEMEVLNSSKHHGSRQSRIFTQREQQILVLLGQGYTAPEIADSLFISVETVKSHRKNMLAKTRLKNTTELVAFCIKQGYV